MVGYDILNAVINVHSALELQKSTEGKYFVMMKCYNGDDDAKHTFALMKENYIGRKSKFVRTDSGLPIPLEFKRVMFHSVDDAIQETEGAIQRFIQDYLCNVALERSELGYGFIPAKKQDVCEEPITTEQNFVEVKPLREFCAWILGECDGKRMYFDPDKNIFNDEKEVKLSLIGLDKLFSYMRENKMSGERIFIHEYD